jgi:hypothetical protein
LSHPYLASFPVPLPTMTTTPPPKRIPASWKTWKSRKKSKSATTRQKEHQVGTVYNYIWIKCINKCKQQMCAPNLTTCLLSFTKKNSANKCASKWPNVKISSIWSISLLCDFRQRVCLTNLGRDSPIFLQFFYLFSIFFLNCFLIASNSSGPSSDLAGNSFQLKSDSPTFLNSF